MPQATKALSDEMLKRFGSAVDSTGPQEFLESKGYTLSQGWMWNPPAHVKNYGDMTQEEYNCLLFLVQEWDYGGLNIEKELS